MYPERLQMISALAHRFYEEEGRPEGHDREHWYRAEKEYEESLKRAAADQPPLGTVTFDGA